MPEWHKMTLVAGLPESRSPWNLCSLETEDKTVMLAVSAEHPPYIIDNDGLVYTLEYYIASLERSIDLWRDNDG